MKNFLSIIMLFFLQPAFACLNETRVLLNGEFTVSDEESPVPFGHFYYEHKKDYEKELIKLYNSWLKNKNLDDYSDYGVVLVYLGH